MNDRRTRLPAWLRRTLPERTASETQRILAKYGLHTVCEAGKCPNYTECYAARTATFMILGDVCTRNCAFCHIEHGPALPVRLDEPESIARAAEEMGLRYVVITSVTRDDLADEGAGQFAETLKALRAGRGDIRTEVLTPDFHARAECIAQVVGAMPDVYNHNIETVARLQEKLRPMADYRRSLEVLRIAKECREAMFFKSGLMLGLGETRDEILEAAQDLRDVGCDILTLGQYLAPDADSYPVMKYVPPEEFEGLRHTISGMGFREVYAGPYVRSSYHAGEIYKNC